MVCYVILSCDPCASSTQEFYVSIAPSWTAATFDVWSSQSCIFTKMSAEVQSTDEHTIVVFQVGEFSSLRLQFHEVGGLS